MAGTADVTIRQMTIEDYDEVYTLWKETKGFGIRSVDDSREGVERFLRRNPLTSVVAVCGGRIIGDVLCGHDGRQGSFYHVCVHEKYRKRGIGSGMVKYAMEALKQEGINKITLIAFKNNMVGNDFWKEIGWNFRSDVNYYDAVLNEGNRVEFIA
ncbi:GNAT family N-acetyltransferase [Clostridium sp. AM58-1XD]|uniref:GNAT family N-acetyltransferase n=1 Tax=Clostridium sp. AM58-1XD TaxID=2292307 RepID=UPI000E47CDEE|nr:GNAT family N-acetyltransferase [Clostridium sp. AM58-1XD]RGY97160.1 GNAT family N-acetyltransferase [Clostridium sp. AM58-1XD]